MQTVYICTGLPGSGKSTYASRLMDRHFPSMVIVSKDAIRTALYGKYIFEPTLEAFIHTCSKELVSMAVSRGFDVVIDDTNITTAYRKEWIHQIGHFHRRRITLVCLWFTEKEHNLEYRMRDPKGLSKAVWADVIKSKLERFEPPTLTEGFDQIESYKKLVDV